MSPSHRFTDELRRLAMNYCVDVPADVSRELAGSPPERYVRVEGLAGGRPFRTRLTPRGGGAFRLFLSGAVRDAAGLSAGDAVEVEVRRLEAAGEPEVPADLARALAAVPGGREGFSALTRAQREGMIAFIERARREETRARYVGRIVEEVRLRLARRGGAGTGL